MIIGFKVTKGNYRRKYLEALNGVMGLTKVELDVLEELVRLHDMFTKAGFEGEALWNNVFSSTSRKEIQKNLDMKSRTNVDKYFLFLRNNKIIKDGKLIPIVLKKEDDHELTIQFQLDA